MLTAKISYRNIGFFINLKYNVLRKGYQHLIMSRPVSAREARRMFKRKRDCFMLLGSEIRFFFSYRELSLVGIFSRIFSL